MSENIEDQFSKFLADNKIDISALEGTKEKSKLLAEAKEQRNLAIAKAVSRRFSNENRLIMFLKFFWRGLKLMANH